MPQSSSAANINVDINQIATDLNLKADTDLINATPSSGTVKSLLNNAGVKYVVETFHNGTSWYRVYSDGWCEQGGTTSSGDWTEITLLKPYTNTNYTLIAGSTDTNRDGSTCSCAINSKSATGFYIGNYYNGTAYGYSMWYACGWLAQ